MDKRLIIQLLKMEIMGIKEVFNKTKGGGSYEPPPERPEILN
jgi:hypothetical protein